MKTYMKERRLKRRNDLIQKAGGKCLNCSSTVDLEFDHVDPKDKSFVLSGHNLDKPMKTIIEEYNKCNLLCRKCHVEKTKRNKEHGGGHNKNTSPMKCGTVRKYTEEKCRCDKCKKAKILYRKKQIRYSEEIE